MLSSKQISKIIRIIEFIQYACIQVLKDLLLAAFLRITYLATRQTIHNVYWVVPEKNGTEKWNLDFWVRNPTHHCLCGVM